MTKKKYKTKDLCNIFDISRATLFRWEKEGLISGISRDWRNWRLYTDRTVIEIKRIIRKRNERHS